MDARGVRCGRGPSPLTLNRPIGTNGLAVLEAILGVPPKAGKFEKYGQTSLANQLDWDELDTAEDNDRVFSQTESIQKGAG